MTIVRSHDTDKHDQADHNDHRPDEQKRNFPSNILPFVRWIVGFFNRRFNVR